MGYTIGMKTAVSIPDDIFASADAFARRTGRSRSELYATAVREYLARHQEDPVTAQLDALFNELDGALPEDLAQAADERLAQVEW